MKNSELFMVPLTILLHLFAIYVDEAHNGVKYFLNSSSIQFHKIFVQKMLHV